MYNARRNSREENIRDEILNYHAPDAFSGLFDRRAHRRIDLRQPFQAQPAQCHDYFGADRFLGCVHAARLRPGRAVRTWLSFKRCLLSAG